jgi:hypothetical protein
MLYGIYGTMQRLQPNDASPRHFRNYVRLLNQTLIKVAVHGMTSFLSLERPILIRLVHARAFANSYFIRI